MCGSDGKISDYLKSVADSLDCRAVVSDAL